MNLKQAIFERKSIRSFLDTKVESEKISEIIKAAMYAPSASNRQAWKFIVITQKDIMQDICSMNGGAIPTASKLILGAPAGILVLYRNDVSKNSKIYKDHIQSAAASIQNMLLSAHSLGLGTCWICKLPHPRHLRKKLNIPTYFDVIGYIAIGYPKEYMTQHTINHYNGNSIKAAKRKRKYSIEEVISYNKFEDYKNQDAFKYPKVLYLLQEIQLRIKNDEKHKRSKKFINKLLIHYSKIKKE